MKNRNKLIFLTHQLWNNYLFSILLFLVGNFSVIAQNEQQEFRELANKINIKIAKALLTEKDIPNSEIDESMTSDELINSLKYPENKQLAHDIDKIIRELTSNVQGLGVKNSLSNLIKRSLSIIPKQNDQKRKNTIATLRTELYQMIEGVEEETHINNQKEKNESNQVINTGDSEVTIPLYLWVLFLILFGVGLYNLIKLILLNKNHTNLKNRYNKFVSEQKSLNQKYSEKGNNSFPQRVVQAVSISDSEIERIKNLIIYDIKLSLRENEFFDEREAIGNIIQRPFSSSEQEPNKNYILKYIEAPEKEGYFDRNFLSLNETPKSLYKIIVYTETNKMVFDILLNKFAIHRKAMDQAYNILKPACDYKEDPKPTDQQILKLDNSYGILEINNDKLIIVEKLKIKFG